MRKYVWIMMLLSAASATCQGAKTLQEPPLENFVGHWKSTGTVYGTPTHPTLDVKWTVNHQFSKIVQKDEGTNGEPRFEADFFVGYDGKIELYVSFLRTSFGGSDSPTGSGAQEGDELA